MNEIKRQLDKKMGDTTRRSEQIMKNVERKKTQVAREKSSSTLYYVTLASFAAILGIILYVNPFIKTEPLTSTPPINIGTPTEQLQENKTLPLKNFFKQNGDVAYFIGDFSEYSSFTETTIWLSDDYVQLLIDNGGSLSRQIYKIKKKSIELVFEDMPEFSNVGDITIDHLKTLEPISTLLQWPIENSSTFEDKVVTYPVELKTPYKNFNKVIQVTHEMESTKVDYYYAEDYGLIGRVTTFEDGLQVSSLLASMNTEPTENPNATIQVFNKTLNREESLPFHTLFNFDPLFLYKPELETTTITYETILKQADRELGIIELDPTTNGISRLFVERTNDSIELLGTQHGEFKESKYSPNKDKIAFRFSSNNVIEIGTALIDYILIFDVNNFSFSSFIEEKDYPIFSSPIVSMDWISNNQIAYTVPDLEIMTFEAILEWQQATEKPTKPMIATLQ